MRAGLRRSMSSSDSPLSVSATPPTEDREEARGAACAKVFATGCVGGVGRTKGMSLNSRPDVSHTGKPVQKQVNGRQREQLDVTADVSVFDSWIAKSFRWIATYRFFFFLFLDFLTINSKKIFFLQKHTAA